MKAEISILIPLFNEAGSIDPLLEKLSSVMDSLGRSYEVIIVDDGSTDGSAAKLDEALPKHPNLRVVVFRRNSARRRRYPRP